MTFSSRLSRLLSRSSAPRRRGLLALERLEDRLAPATFAEMNGQLLLDLDTTGEALAVVSQGEAYQLTLTGGTWVGTDSANATGNGTDTLLVSADVFDAVSVGDLAGGTSVTFDDSGANAYVDDFLITLDDAAAGTIQFDGVSDFGTSSVNASTTRDVVVNVGATVSATSGGVTLTANQQEPPTAGSFSGIDVGGTVSTTTGALQLTGRGGDDAGTGNHYGVSVLGLVSTITGDLTLTGTGGAGADQNYGVNVAQGGLVNSAGGTIQVTGTGGSGTNTFNVGVLLFAGQVINAGSGTVTIDGTGGTGTASSHGVYLEDSGAQILTVDGAISITGTAGTGTNSVGIISSGSISTLIGLGDVGLIADSITLDAGSSVTAGANPVTIVPETASFAIDLGGADSATALGLDNAELNTITAGTLSVGDGNTGAIAVSATVAASAGTSLTLTGSTISVNAALSTADVTSIGVARSGNVTLIAASGVALNAAVTTGTVENPAADGFAISGAIVVSSTAGGLTGNASGRLVTGDATFPASTLAALATSGAIAVNVSGAVQLSATNALTTGNVSTVGTSNIVSTGNVSVAASKLSSDGGTGQVLVKLGIPDTVSPLLLTQGVFSATTNGGAGVAGSVFIVSNQPLSLGAISSNGGTVNVTSLGLTVTAAIDAGAGQVGLTALTGMLTNLSSITSTNAVVLVADKMDLRAGSTVNTSASLVQAATGTVNADLGSTVDTTANTLELSQAELNTLTAAGLTIFINNATVNVSQSITLNQPTDVRGNGGITESVSGEGAVFIADSLILSASGGDVGASDDIDVQVNNLSFNVPNGSVQITNLGALTVTTLTIIGFGPASPTAGSGSVTATSPLTIASDVTSAGDFTLTAGETDDAPTFADVLTINAGVTVSSTGGSLTLNAGDDVVIDGSASAATTLAVNAGFGDLDGGGTSVSATTLTAPSLALTAVTGIGSAGSPLLTQTSNLEAETVTGGIFISNGLTALSIGGVDESLGGVRVTGASGDVVLTNDGSIDVTTNGEILFGPGAISVSAVGAAADLVTGGDNVDFAAAVRSSGGNVSLSAGRDLLIGGGATPLPGDVVADAGNVGLMAGRDVILLDTFVDARTSGDTITVTAGRDVQLQEGSFGGSRFQTVAGAIALTAGSGGTFLLSLNSEVSTPAGGAGAAVSVSADVMIVDGTIDAGPATVTLSPATPGTAIDLGSATDAAASTLELSDDELGRITAGVLRIGDLTNTSAVTVTSAITTHAGYDTLSLRSAGTVTAAAETSIITVGSLAVQAVGSVDLALLGAVLNSVGTVAANVTGMGSTFDFSNNVALTIGTVDGVSGITTNNGGLALRSNGNITVANNVGAGTAGIFVQTGSTRRLTNQAAISGAGVSARADDYDLQLGSTITVTGEVNLRANTGGFGFDLGSNAVGVGVINLSQAELDTITAPADLRFTSAASVTFSQPIVLTPAKVTLLVIEAVNGVIDGNATGADLTVNRVAFKVNTGIDLDTAVGTLAFRNTIDAVNVRNAGALTIGSLFDVPTSSNTGTTTTISASSPLTFAVNTSSAGDATYTAAETDDAPTFADVLTINAGATVSSTGGSLTLNAGDDVVIDGTASAATTLAVNAGFGDLDGGGAIVSATTLTAPSLALSAITGIGTSASPLQTQTSNLEAESSTGGIFISNGLTAPTTLSIGGVSAALDGVRALTSGNVSLVNQGSIFITEAAGEDVFAAVGNVLVRAEGVTADVQTGNDNNDAIDSDNGNVTVVAGRDLLLGDGSGFGDVEALGDVMITAGRDVVLFDGQADAFGTGSLTATAGRNVSLFDGGTQSSRLTTEGGDLIVTTGADGLLTVDADNASNAIRTTRNGGNGNLTINADRFEITTDDRISAGTGIVTIKPVSAVWAIDLGSAGDVAASTLEMSDAEIDRIIASVLRIGDAANAGDVNVTALVDPANVSTLHLLTAGGIFDPVNNGVELRVANLALTAGNGIGDSLAGGDLDVSVDNLAATNANGGIVLIQNDKSVTITTVDGVQGLRNNASGEGLQLDTLAGSITVTDADGGSAFDVFAAGSGNVNLLAADALTVSAFAIVRSDTGTVSLTSNFDDAGTGEDVTLEAGSSVLTAAGVVLNADPNADGTGGTVALGGTIATPAGGIVDSLTIVVAPDFAPGALAAVTTLSVTSTGGRLLDDGSETTALAAMNVSLGARTDVGGGATIDPVEVINKNGDYLGAIDVDLQGGTLTVTQDNAGFVQLREVSGGLTLSSLDFSGVSGASGTQVALISSGGDLSIDTSLTLAAAVNVDLLLATTDGNSITIGGVVTNNGATATTNLVASGSPAAAITAPTSDGNANVIGQNVGLFTTGGTVSSAASPLEINASRLDGSTAGGNAFVTDVGGGVTVGLFDAGTGDVTLASLTGPITGVTPNDGVAEIIGDVVTLDVSQATSNGNTGQIGFFSGTAQFFEIDANVLNASTNDSRLWIAEVGSGANAGTAIGTVTAGTNTAFLRVANGGTLTSEIVDGVADVTAAVVNLSAPVSGAFGLGAASPLEIAAATLAANVTGGGVFVLDVGSGLALNNVTVATGSLSVTTTESAAAGETLSLNAGVTVLAFGDVELSAGDGINLPDTATLSAGTTLTLNVAASDAGDGSTSSLLGTLTAPAATVQGGSGIDSFILSPSATTPVNVLGDVPAPPASPGDSLTLNLTGATGTALTATNEATGLAGTFAFTNRQDVTFAQIETLSPTATITGVVFADANGNGTREANEPGIAGVAVTLDRGADGTPDATATTDAAGAYSFLIEAGTTVRLRATLPAGQVQTTTDPADFVTQDGGNAVINFGSNTPTPTIPTTPPSTVKVATAAGTVVTVPLNGGPLPLATTTPFAGFGGELRAARGDVNGDGVVDDVYSAGPGAPGGHVKVFDGATGAEIRSFFAFQGFSGGAFVGAGDVNGDGADDVIVGAGPGAPGGHVKVFDGKTGAEIRSFFAFVGFIGSVRVAGGDVNGDGNDDVIVGAGAGAPGGHVKVFDGATGAQIRSFFAYEGFPGGVFVGAADLDGDGKAEILTGADAGAGPHVKAFGATDQALLSFFAFGQGFSGGVRVAGADVDGDGDDEIVVGNGPGDLGHLSVFESDLRLVINRLVDGGLLGIYVA